jgi:hypothetical protein
MTQGLEPAMVQQAHTKEAAVAAAATLTWRPYLSSAHACAQRKQALSTVCLDDEVT